MAVLKTTDLFILRTTTESSEISFSKKQTNKKRWSVLKFPTAGVGQMWVWQLTVLLCDVEHRVQHASNSTHSSLFLLFTIDDHGSRPEPGTLPLHTQIWVSVVLARTTHTHEHRSTEGVAVSMSGLSLTHRLLPFWVQQSQLFLSVLRVCVSLQFIHELICSRPTVQIPPRMISWFYCRVLPVQTKEG